MFVVNTDSFFVSHRLPIALAAMEDGFEVHLASSQTDHSENAWSKELTFHPLSLDRRSSGIVSNLRTFFQLFKLFKQTKPDLVHLVTIKPVLLGGLAARLAGLPSVVAAISGLGFIFIARGVRANLRRWLVGSLYRLALGHPNLKVIFQNEDDRECLTRLCALPHHKTALIRGSGVDLANYKNSTLPTGIPVVMLAARLLVDKGVHEFVEAARFLKNHGSIARFVLVGDPDPGNPNTINENELTRWVDNKVVEWWGPRSDMPKILASCYVFVLPSFYGEGLPKVLMEASACGRPIVTTDHPGCRDAIEPNKTGFLVPPRDAEALAEGINTLLKDRSLCEEMGRAGRELAESVFDIKQVVEQHMHIYDELLQNTAPQ